MTNPSMPSGAPNLEEILIQSREVPWREKSLKGVHEKMLWRDDATGASIALINFDKGAGIPKPHSHASNQFMFCLEGNYDYTCTTGDLLTPGSFYWNPKGNVHGPTDADEDTVVIEDVRRAALPTGARLVHRSGGRALAGRGEGHERATEVTRAYGTIRSSRNRVRRRTNISSLSTTSWKPNCRALTVLVITSQSQPKT